MSSIRVRLLGTVQVRRDGVDRVLVGRRQRATLAVLALAAGTPVHPETLAARVWGADGGGSRANTQTTISRLRRLLGPGTIRTEPGGYRLAVARDQVDVLALLDRCATAGAVGSPGVAGSAEQERAALVTALADWSSEPFGGEDLSDWLTGTEVPRLLGLRLRALERRLELDLELGPARHCTAELQELTAAHPLRESLWALLIRSLAAEDRAAEALAAYDVLRGVLAEELGADPAPALQELHRQLLQPDPAPVTPGAPPGAAPTVPRQLPAVVRDFSGRHEELARLGALLAPGDEVTPGRLVLVHGSGGVGKTSLVAHAGRTVADRFPDGQLFVNLRGFGPGPVTTPRAAQEFVLRSLGVPGRQIPRADDERTALLRSQLGARRLLLVLDDARDPDQVRPLLPGGPSTVVVTSRSRLRGLAVSAGADLLALAPMSPAESLQLLRRRLQAPTDDATLSELATLCGHLPIALAVAAERAGRPGGGPDALVRRLRDEHQRLAELSPDDDPLASVRAVFAPTYQDLDPGSAALFRLLSLHPNAPISTGAAAALSGHPESALEPWLERLTDSHLLQAPRPGGFELHQLARDYAAEQRASHPAEEAADARRRLVSWAIHSADAACRTLDRYSSMIEAGELAPGVHPQTPATAAEALSWFGSHRAVLTRLVHGAAQRGEHETAHRLVPRLTYYLSRIGSDEEITLSELGLRCATALGSHEAIAMAANNVGVARGRAGQYDAAMAAFRAVRTHFRLAGHRLGVSRATGNIALVLDLTGHRTQAVVLLEGLLADQADWAPPEEMLNGLNNLANSYAHLERFPEALRTIQRYESVARVESRPLFRARAEDSRGSIQLTQGQPEEACRSFARAREFYRAAGNLADAARTSRDLGRAHLAAGRPRQAAELWEQCLAQLDGLDSPEQPQLTHASVRELLAALPRTS